MENSITATKGMHADLLSTQLNSHSVSLFHDSSLIRLLSHYKDEDRWLIAAHLSADSSDDQIIEFDGFFYEIDPVLTYAEFTAKQLCSRACKRACESCPIIEIYNDLTCRSSSEDIAMLNNVMNAVIDDLS